jgi:L-asparaginase II
MSEVLIHVTRGSVVESRHAASVVLSDTSGHVRAFAGNPDRIAFWRSAAKPLQALPLVVGGGMEHFGLQEDELAVMTGSHSGDEVHVQAVQSILARIGLSEEHLRCGAHPPLSKAAAAELARARELPRAVHCNCSGKHAGLLALARLHGWPVEGYLELEHPVGQTVMATIEALTGVPAAVMPVGIDGCGLPTAAVTIRAIATAFARLADPSSLPPDLGKAALRVTQAMRRYPHMVAGSGRFDTSLMAATAGRLFCKGGAEGVLAIGLPELGLGLAMKVEDGGARALPPLGVDILTRLGVLTEEEARSLADLHRPVVRNTAGMVVGSIEAIVPESLASDLLSFRQDAV